MISLRYFKSHQEKVANFAFVSHCCVLTKVDLDVVSIERIQINRNSAMSVEDRTVSLGV